MAGAWLALGSETRTSMLRSRDGGLAWFGQETPDPAGGNGTAIAQLSDGTVIANAYHHLFAKPGDEACLAGRPHRQEVKHLGMIVAGGGVFMVRSENDGYTWTAPRHIEEPPGWPGVASHGAVCELPDGELLLPVTGKRTETSQALGMALRSRDRGETWGEPTCLTDDAPVGIDFHETRLVLCPSGDIVATHRTEQGNYFRNSSTDGGRTWSETQDTGIWCGGSSPPDLRLLADGRLLLSRGYRREPFGVRVFLSEGRGAHVAAGDRAPRRRAGQGHRVPQLAAARGRAHAHRLLLAWGGSDAAPAEHDLGSAVAAGRNHLRHR